MKKMLLATVILGLICVAVEADEPVMLPKNLPEKPAVFIYVPSVNLGRTVSVLPLLSDGTWDTGVTLQVWHLQGTASPGDPNNMVIVGHRTLPTNGAPDRFITWGW